MAVLGRRSEGYAAWICWMPQSLDVPSRYIETAIEYCRGGDYCVAVYHGLKPVTNPGILLFDCDLILRMQGHLWKYGDDRWTCREVEVEVACPYFHLSVSGSRLPLMSSPSADQMNQVAFFGVFVGNVGKISAELSLWKS